MKNHIEHVYNDDEGYNIYRVELDAGSYYKVFNPGEEPGEDVVTNWGFTHYWFKASQCYELEIKIVKYLFRALWDSDNGCTTFISVEEICKNCDISKENLRFILQHFGMSTGYLGNGLDLFNEGILEWQEDENEVGIFFDFFEYFDIKSFKLY